MTEMLRSTALAGTSLSRIVALFCGPKGGIGKSFACGIMASAFSAAGQRVILVDGDGTNSTTYSTHDNVQYLHTSAVEARGAVRTLIRKVGAGADSVLFDFGARDDDIVTKHTPWLVAECKAVSACLVIVVPITDEPTTHMTAVKYAGVALPAGAGLLFLKNLGCSKGALARWERSPSRREAIDRGAVECELGNLGSAADRARGFRLSVADVALGRFERAGERAQQAAQEFDEDTQAWCGIWLDEQCSTLISAVQAAVNRQSR